MDEQIEPKGVNVTMILFGFLLLVLVGGGVYYYINQKQVQTPLPQKPKIMQPTATATQIPASPSATLEPTVKSTTASGVMPSVVTPTKITKPSI